MRTRNNLFRSSDQMLLTEAKSHAFIPMRDDRGTVHSDDSLENVLCGHGMLVPCSADGHTTFERARGFRAQAIQD